MYKTPRMKFRSNFFSSENLSTDLNLCVSEVDKFCTKSRKIIRSSGVQRSWVLRKNYYDEDDVPYGKGIL
jgi:hypothetical protein